MVNLGAVIFKLEEPFDLHLKNVYSDGELLETSTTEDFSVVHNQVLSQRNRDCDDQTDHVSVV